jgi:predicted ATPase
MVLLERVRLKNYKSIASCDVELGSLTFLVGPNGSGKSNFLDALRFVRDALRTSLEHALRDRGGVNEVRRRSSGHPTHFGIRLDFCLSERRRGHYAFEIAAQAHGGYEVRQEECSVVGPHPATFRVRNGQLLVAQPRGPSAAKDRLYLVSASGLPEFREVHDALSRMGFYNLNPDRIRDLQDPHVGDLLERDGSNLTSVLSQLESRAPERKERIEQYLSRIVPGLEGVAVIKLGPKETLEFRQAIHGARYPWRFLAANMSDGTLRALGILVCLFQSGNSGAPRVPLVGIEEPEVALHPAAAGVLLDALREASASTQVLVSSHSPDLLDSPEIPTEAILAVEAEQGITRIGPIDESGRSALRKRLYTPGELLRLNQLQPDPATPPPPPSQLRLFD